MSDDFVVDVLREQQRKKDQAIMDMRELAKRLAPLYIKDDQSLISRARLAWLCDEVIDRSGVLLGFIRDIAFASPKSTEAEGDK